jgi:hypothetical protein
VLRAVLETGLALERARSDAAVAALGLSLSSDDAKMLRDAAAYTVDFAQGLTPETALFARIQVTRLLQVVTVQLFLCSS